MLWCSDQQEMAEEAPCTGGAALLECSFIKHAPCTLPIAFRLRVHLRRSIPHSLQQRDKRQKRRGHI